MIYYRNDLLKFYIKVLPRLKAMFFVFPLNTRQKKEPTYTSPI